MKMFGNEASSFDSNKDPEKGRLLQRGCKPPALMDELPLTQNIYQKKKLAVIQMKMRKLAVLGINMQYENIYVLKLITTLLL
jgi:hypothetical protein